MPNTGAPENLTVFDNVLRQRGTIY